MNLCAFSDIGMCLRGAEVHSERETLNHSDGSRKNVVWEFPKAIKCLYL